MVYVGWDSVPNLYIPVLYIVYYSNWRQIYFTSVLFFFFYPREAGNGRKNLSGSKKHCSSRQNYYWIWQANKQSEKITWIKHGQAKSEGQAIYKQGLKARAKHNEQNEENRPDQKPWKKPLLEKRKTSVGQVLCTASPLICVSGGSAVCDLESGDCDSDIKQDNWVL